MAEYAHPLLVWNIKFVVIALRCEVPHLLDRKALHVCMYVRCVIMDFNGIDNCNKKKYSCQNKKI